MAGLFDLTAQQGMMAQNAADEAAEMQGRIYDRNKAVKAANWQEAGQLVKGLAKSAAKYKGAADQRRADMMPPSVQQQAANEAAGRDPLDNGPASASIRSVIGGTLRNMWSQ